MTKKAKIIIAILATLLVGFAVVYLFVLRLERITYYEDGVTLDEYGEPVLDDCNVGGINIHGEITTYLPESLMTEDFASSEDIMATLDYIEKNALENQTIKAIVLDIDSYGGSPVGAEELSLKIRELSLPVVVMIRSAATSAAYWIASAGDYIFASKLSDIGSIGVTMSYLDESKLNQKEGYTWNSISTGKYKDAGERNKPLTQEERALFERDLKITYDEFVSAVSENRGIPKDKVYALADGSTMLGEMALKEGLIDQIGYITDVEKYIEATYNIKPEICWY